MKIKEEQGMSLVEVLVAAVILLIALVPLMRVLMYGLETGNRANKMTLATNLARDIAEEMRSQAFSEEFVRVQLDSGCLGVSNQTVYPYSDSLAQCFGLESDESVATATNGGRILVFDDIDDYGEWCRGDCNDTPDDPSDDTFLETFDGYLYNGSQGYPAYNGFTRRVRVHNLSAVDAEISVDGSGDSEPFEADPFPDYTSGGDKTLMLIRRYRFDNWSSLTRSGTTFLGGLTPLKRIEVTVTYDGIGAADVEVVDVSYAVMPLL